MFKLSIDYRKLNPDFDQEYADEYHLKKESDGNWKYNDRYVYLIEEIIGIEEIIHKVYELQIVNNKNVMYNLILKNILEIKCLSTDNLIESFFISKSIVKKKKKSPPNNKKLIRYYIDMNENPVSIQLLKGSFIDIEDIPAEILLDL